MTKKLTVEEIKDKLCKIKFCLYCGNVEPKDRRLWTRYINLLNKRKMEKNNGYYLK